MAHVVVSDIGAIIRIVQWMLLAIDQCHAVDVVVLVVVGVLVATHDQLLLCSLQTDRAHWLVALGASVDIRHVLAAYLIIVPLVPAPVAQLLTIEVISGGNRR